MKTLKLRKRFQKKRIFRDDIYDNIDIVKAANRAFDRAFKNARRLGLPVIKRENNKLIKIYPNGKEEIIKTTKMVKVERRSCSIY